MKRQRASLILVLLIWSLSILVAGGKDFWAQKPYGEWSEKEVEKLLKNSPWARTVTLSAGLGGRGRGSIEGEAAEIELRGTPRAPGEERNLEGSSVRGPGGESRAGREPGSASYGTGLQPTVVIIWYSNPIRQAMARRLQLRNQESTREQLDKVLNFRSRTVDFLVVGWASRFQSDRSGEALQKLREGTYLQKRGKEKIPLANLVLPNAPGQSLVFSFPREVDGKPAVTLEDREVDLVTKIGGNTIRTRFKLSDMVVNGQLEL